MKLNNIAVLATIGAVTILLASCSKQTSPVPLSEEATQEYAQTLRYERDDRTGLCFAFLETTGSNVAMTSVPCEPLEKRGFVAASAPQPTAEQNPMVDPLTGTAHNEVGMADP